MKINKGQKIMDYCGFVYEIQEIYEKYVTVDGGLKVLHEDYMVLPEGVTKDDVALLESVYTKIYELHGEEVMNEVSCAVTNRFNYIKEGKYDPRHVFTFEDCEGLGGDNCNEYEPLERDSSCS